MLCSVVMFMVFHVFFYFFSLKSFFLGGKGIFSKSQVRVCDGLTALHLAARNGNPELVRMVLDALASNYLCFLMIFMYFKNHLKTPVGRSWSLFI